MIAVFLMRKLERLQVLNLGLCLKIRGNRSEPQTKASLLHTFHAPLLNGPFYGVGGGKGSGDRWDLGESIYKLYDPPAYQF